MSITARITLDEYDRMIAEGIFDGPHRSRIELIHGELRTMTPIGPEHEEIVDFLSRWSWKNTPEKTIRIRVQQSMGIPEFDSAPEPDIAWVGERSYASGRPRPADVLLIIEVAASSLPYDRGVKADLYAAGIIQDYWIVNLYDRTVEVRREPQAGLYQSVQVYGSGESVHPLCLPTVVLDIDQMFATLN